MLTMLNGQSTTSLYPKFLTRLCLDMFAIVVHWRPNADVIGPARGRLFEDIFCRYCRYRGLPLKERPGSRTVDGQLSASGFLHESDGVIVTPDLLVHLELKHLGGAVEKNDLLIFNQKGLDFLFAKNAILRERPFFRVILSGSPLSEAARRFCINWGISAIEPDRLPLLCLYSFASEGIVCEGISSAIVEEIQNEIPVLIAPLQVRTRRFVETLTGSAHFLHRDRAQRALTTLQKTFGDRYWRVIERNTATSVLSRYEALRRVLRL
jgi:hypothetical protein